MAKMRVYEFKRCIYFHATDTRWNKNRLYLALKQSTLGLSFIFRGNSLKREAPKYAKLDLKILLLTLGRYKSLAVDLVL